MKGAVLRNLAILFVTVFPVLAFAQRITYTAPEQDDSRKTNFEIIGKMNGNIVVFKNNRSDNVFCVYDNDMKLVKRVKLDFMPDKYINVDFINYQDFCYMIYEYQKKNIVHCTYVKLDPEGKRLSEPADLDTTLIGFAASNKIYSTIFSENKERIMVFKINSKNPKSFLFTSFLYDKNLSLIDRHRIPLDMEEKNDIFTEFLLDNEGEFVFGKFLKNNSSDYISKVSLIRKGPTADTFAIRDLGTNDRVLDEIKVKVDNNNRRFILTGFYYKQKRGNIEGVYSAIWDKASDSKIKETLTVFNDELRSLAKSSDANLKMAFNDFFIKLLVTQKDGGYLVVSEADYTSSRGSAFNRWDYMYGYSPWMNPMDNYYSSYYNPYSPWNRYGNPNSVRYHSENILVLSFDKDNNLEWSNVIPKSQFDDDSENLISHIIMNTGGELHFLYNQSERRNLLLNDQSIAPNGKVTRYPTLRNLDKGYDFMPRYGRQISGRQLLLPCLYRNYLCFAKVEF